MPQLRAGYLQLIALLVWVLGLAAPLTPSEGSPTWLALIGFGIVPVILVIAATFQVRSWWVRVLFGLEAAVILLLTIGLARL